MKTIADCSICSENVNITCMLQVFVVFTCLGGVGFVDKQTPKEQMRIIYIIKVCVSVLFPCCSCFRMSDVDAPFDRSAI